MEITTLPRIVLQNARVYPNHIAQLSKDKDEVFQPTTFTQFHDEVLTCAAGLRDIGIKRGDHVGFVSDNRKEWLILDLGLLSLGAADVPRGCDSRAEELAYILSFGDCKTVVLENEAQMEKILSQREKMPQLSMFIIIDNDFDKAKYSAALTGISVVGYRDIMEKGKTFITNEGNKSIIAEIELGKIDDVATIIFTSGTTGEPKGVMLSHNNILNQAINAYPFIQFEQKDVWLTVLPVWNSFERAMQYIALYTGGTLAYSKPVGPIMLADFQKVRPQWLTAVPRLWEALRAGVYRNAAASGKVKLLNFFVSVSATHQKFKNMILGRAPQFKRRIVLFDILIAIIPFLLLSPLRGLANLLVFKKIKNMLGGKLKAGISGGAALPETVDKFFGAAGIKILEGYGLTETAPVVAVRLCHNPVAETLGPQFINCEITIRDPDTFKEMKPGQKGVVYVRGVQVMKGYYKRPEETKKVIDSEGWFNTGDIGLKTWKGELKLTGRAKDTIVLLGGENIEPVPIEDKIRDSIYIDHAVVLGQDKKYLAALIVPNFDNIEAYAKQNAVTWMDKEGLVKSPEIRKLIQSEINERVSLKTGFRGFEMIFRSVPVAKPFEPGKELSGKMDYKRHTIAEIYKKEITELFAE
jgi:long-chain acyl-CoA synthetase